jgi:threonine dehydratase
VHNAPPTFTHCESKIVTDIINDTAALAADAAARISGQIERTELARSDEFSDALSANVYFKLENLQTTGSFKLRGATNRLMTLSEEDRAKGCVTASSGNHGAACARAMQKLGTRGIIFVPEQTSKAKVDKIRSYGGDARFHGTDGLDTEQHARAHAEENGMVYLSPYNDTEVVAGQGTCGIEILDQLSDVDAVFVAVGGGGLIAGVGAVLKARNPDIRVYGCQPSQSAVMMRSVEAGEIVDLESGRTLSDATAGGIEHDSITFPLNEAVVDEWVSVEEPAIAAAMRSYMNSEGHAIEGAAGVAIAAMILRREEVEGKNVVVVICGGNISEETLDQVRAGGEVVQRVK